ncbi:HpcH/HpaI aldolase family protein [Kribbella shirazensis]|uniref:4-hydroxy-2-oxoheptanedioate aldolase n=1 Tax=Kribbella shirazensis TaxID=1105143 RepID=A0A7X6A4L4_9ACTN|nr:aldolase/citrate lyase family protein [Kribbella shirazensis]NIK61581.1 4-hydroxy-2-oxoheptanedioate aldolase [Kribbella shirazensis]
MDNPQRTPRSLKARLSAGEQLLGALVRMPAEDNLEMLGVAGFDFVIVDCEHGPADVVALRHHITIADLYGMGVLVRIGGGESALALRALDQGAEGIVAPHVDSAEDAAELVRSVHYPPLGERGFATYPRAGRFGTVVPEDHLRRAAESTLVIAMLESPAAVAATSAILRTPGVDGYLIGAADLGASSTDTDPSVAEAIQSIRADADGTGTLRCDLVPSLAAARASLADGAQLVAYNVAHVLMTHFTELRVD